MRGPLGWDGGGDTGTVGSRPRGGDTSGVGNVERRDRRLVCPPTKKGPGRKNIPVLGEGVGGSGDGDSRP